MFAAVNMMNYRSWSLPVQGIGVAPLGDSAPMGSWIDLVEGTASFGRLAKAGDLKTLPRVLIPTVCALTGVVSTTLLQ